MSKSEVKFKETIIGRIPEDFERGDDLVKAISEFLLKECFLLKNNLNERSITHKLAEYIQKYFSDYNVDCEYNRMPNKRNNNGEAETKFIPKELHLNVSQTCSDDDKGTTVYPDIIIHEKKVSDLFIPLLPTVFDMIGSFYFKKKGVRFIYSITPDCV